MDTNPVSEGNEAQRLASGESELVIEPLRPKRIPRAVAEMERLAVALHGAISTDLDLVKREILQRLGAVETSAEAIARELARRRSPDGNETSDADLP